MRFDEYHLPPDKCPYCDSKIDPATEMDDTGTRPEPGDFTVCLSCSGLLRWDDKMNLVKVTIDDVPEENRTTIMISQALATNWRRYKKKQKAKMN